MQRSSKDLGISRGDRKKIVIVGAGAAGIGCARWLLDHYDNYEDGAASSVDVVVLEARDRIGGRVNSASFGGALVDLGMHAFVFM